MLCLYFVRHGETEWNKENRLQGQLDSRLTEKGIRDAELLAKKLTATPFEMIVSSPSKRAVQTAKILQQEIDLPIETDRQLMEINHGSWQGKTISEIIKNEEKNYRLYTEKPHLFEPIDGDGESFQDVKTRLESFIKKQEEKFGSGHLLIVTHGVVIKMLQLLGKKHSIDKLWDAPHIDGTSLTILRIVNGESELLLEGDVSHKQYS